MGYLNLMGAPKCVAMINDPVVGDGVGGERIHLRLFPQRKQKSLGYTAREWWAGSKGEAVCHEAARGGCF